MKPLKSKKKFFALLLAVVMMFSSFSASFTLNAHSRNEVTLEQSDSTEVKSPSKKKVEISDQKQNVSESSASSTNLAYNIIYYLISIFIRNNPLSRPA